VSLCFSDICQVAALCASSHKSNGRGIFHREEASVTPLVAVTVAAWHKIVKCIISHLYSMPP